VIRDGLARRDVLSHNDQGRQDGTTPIARPARIESSRLEEMAQLDLGEVPTGDLRARGGRPGLLSRLDARTRSILTAAAAAAVLVNAGVVWAYWHITGSETGRAYAGAVVELNLRGRSDLNKPLTPGSIGDLTVTVTNDNDFPIRITSVSPAPGAILADDEHRENGCVDNGVAVGLKSAKVQWNVARNNVEAYTVPGGLTMAATSDPACAGAVFTIPVLVTGIAGAS
jgi:hypothetical protein